MLENLQHWCRLCAKIESTDEDIVHKMESIKNHLEIINKHFTISLLPFEDIQSYICADCGSFLTKLECFDDRCMKVDQMFREILLKENISDEDLESVRLKYGVDNEELKYSVILSQLKNGEELKEDIVVPGPSSDPLDVDIKNSCPIKEEIVELDVQLVKRKRGRPRKSEQTVLLQKSKKEKIIEKIVENDSEDMEESDDDFQDYVPGGGSSGSEDDDKPLQKRQRGPRKSKTKENICEICSKTYSRRALLNVHIRDKHTKEGLPYACSSCPKRFITEKKLRVHETMHLPDEQKYTIPCPYCGKKFRTMENLQAHNRAVHINNKPFVCEECGKSFRKRSVLAAHQVTHSDDRIFQCSYCSKKFKTRQALKRHEDIHDDTTYDCPHCDLKLNTKRTLSMHMLVHSDVKKYKCHYCGNEYKRAKTFKDHLFLHTGQRPYECPFCDKTFASGANCRSHKKKAHPVELAALEASGVQPKPPNIPKMEQLRAQEPASLPPLLSVQPDFKNGKN